jgi:hypothetical protein
VAALGRAEPSRKLLAWKPWEERVKCIEDTQKLGKLLRWNFAGSAYRPTGEWDHVCRHRRFSGPFWAATCEMATL